MEKKLNRIIYRTSPNKAMNFLNTKDLQLERDIIDIASVIFNIETAHRMGKYIDKVDIEISDHTEFMCNITKLKEEIEELLVNVLFRDISINFVVKDKGKYKRRLKKGFKEQENICLFSGGIDSCTGLLKSKEIYDDVCAVFVAHNDQPRGINIVNNIMKEINKKNSIPLHTLYAPPMKRYGYSQLRGLLYCLYSSVIASVSNSKRIILTECGPTMYQPRFSPYDTITMTTHPYILKKAKTLIKTFLNRSIDIVIPYENLTKSEVIMDCKSKDLLKKTHSCISLGTGRNEGACYGCTVRRLGAIVTGIEDCQYDYNPMIDPSANIDNLITLLRFSYDFLLDRVHVLPTSKEEIVYFNKQRLFRRFCLDTFAAIYLEKNKELEINPKLNSIYSSFIERMGKSVLEKRVENVRKGRYIPNFNKKI